MGLLAFGPISTKLGGAAWLVLMVMGFMSRWKLDTQADKSPVIRLAQIWLIWCLIAFGLRALIQIYWGDEWGLRHFDIRMVLSALVAIWLMMHLPRPNVSINLFISALLVAAIMGLAVVFLHVQFNLPTPSNRINWTLSLAFMCCLLLGLSFVDGLTRRQHMLIWLGVAINLLSIFLSGTRAAYFLFPWVLGVGGFLLWKNPHLWSKAPVRNFSLIGLGLGLGVYLGMQLSDHPTSPIQRIHTGLYEIQMMLNPRYSQIIAGETSMGIRLSMWARGWELIQAQPLTGYGIEQRIHEIKALGEQLDSVKIQAMSHFHSEFINSWVEHGVLGLLSTLVYLLGLIVLGWRMLSVNIASGIALLGIALLHATASFTNLNSRHNFYGVMLTTCILLALYLIPTASQHTSHERADPA